MSFEEPRFERMLDVYHALVAILYNRLTQQLSNIPEQVVELGIDATIGFSIRFEEPAYITMKALISVLRIDPEERRRLLQLVEEANNVYLVNIDDCVVAICAGVPREKCLEEVRRGRCSEDKERGCLKILYVDEEGSSRLFTLLSTLKIKRLSMLLPIIGGYVLKVLRKDELPVFTE